jgi:Aminotransferase class I and II
VISTVGVDGFSGHQLGHQERAARLKRRLAEAGFPVMPSPSHIVPVMVGDPGLCKATCDELLHRYRIYVQPINYPTVPAAPNACACAALTLCVALIAATLVKRAPSRSLSPMIVGNPLAVEPVAAQPE